MHKISPISKIVNFRQRSIGLMVLLVLSLCVTALAQDPEAIFDKANRAYADGEYQKAIDFYQAILDHHMVSGELYFNLGNAYFKQNQVGRSILYYEKARQFLEGDPSLDHNLKLAQLRIVDKIDDIPILFLEAWWLELIHLFPINTFLWLCLILFGILTLLLILRILLNTGGLRYLIWINLGLFLIAVILTTGQIYEFETSQFGIILVEKVSVVSEPSLSGKEVFMLHEGTKVKVNRQLDEWLEITIPDGKTGWMKTSGLENI